VSFTVTCKYQVYYDRDVNEDGTVDENDDKNGDGIVDKLDVYGDVNSDNLYDIRDIIEAENKVRAKTWELIEKDINNDGIVNDDDDINKDGEVNEDDRTLYARLENLDLAFIGDLNKDDVVDILDGIEYLRILDEIEAAQKEGMQP
jgi:hypothetical protein